MIDEFLDAEHGGFYFTGKSHEALITRQKDLFDNATPSGNAMAATALVRLAAITGRDDLDRIGREALATVETVFEKSPWRPGQSLLALDFAVAPGRELAVVAGADPREFAEVLDAVYARFLPRAVVAPAAREASRRSPAWSPCWRIDRRSATGRRSITARRAPAASRSPGSTRWRSCWPGLKPEPDRPARSPWEGEAPAEPRLAGCPARQEPRPPEWRGASSVRASLPVSAAVE